MADKAHESHQSHLPDVGHEDVHHHHEGPIVHTEITPEKSWEDKTLLAMVCIAAVFLMGTVWNWMSKMEEPPPLAPGHAATGAESSAQPAGAPENGAHQNAPGSGPNATPAAPASAPSGAATNQPQSSAPQTQPGGASTPLNGTTPSGADDYHKW